jgi:3-phenylpropionate/trans-cinnamate dioxygenase ferredoxin subunit
MMHAGFERVALVDELADGVPLSVDLSNDEQICVIRIGAEVYAVSNMCSHADFPLSDGELVDDFVLECGLHGAQFDVRDGSAVELPATEPIGCYHVKVVDGEVWVRVHEAL